MLCKATRDRNDVIRGEERIGLTVCSAVHYLCSGNILNAKWSTNATQGGISTYVMFADDANAPTPICLEESVRGFRTPDIGESEAGRLQAGKCFELMIRAFEPSPNVTFLTGQRGITRGWNSVPKIP